MPYTSTHGKTHVTNRNWPCVEYCSITDHNKLTLFNLIDLHLLNKIKKYFLLLWTGCQLGDLSSRLWASLWLQSWHLKDLMPLNLFAECVQRAMFSIFILQLLIDMYYAWLKAGRCRFRVQVLPCLRIVLYYYKFGFTLSCQLIIYRAMYWCFV